MECGGSLGTSNGGEIVGKSKSDVREINRAFRWEACEMRVRVKRELTPLNLRGAFVRQADGTAKFIKYFDDVVECNRVWKV